MLSLEKYEIRIEMDTLESVADTMAQAGWDDGGWLPVSAWLHESGKLCEIPKIQISQCKFFS